jgi:hypothetical protein
VVTWLFETRRWERLILVTIASVVAYQLFVEPIVGTADNRDWWRVMDQLGLGYIDSPDPTFFKTIQREYQVVPAKHVDYLTSQLLLGRVAVELSDLFSKDGRFDLRWMGAVNAAAFIGAIALLLAAFHRARRWIRIVIGVGALVMFTDVRLVAYFNSFYCEPAQVIFLVAALGFALLTIDDTRPLAQRRRLYAGFVATSILFFFAKTQDLVFCVPFAVIAFHILPSARPRWAARSLVAVGMAGLFVWGMKSDAYAVTHHVNVGVVLGEEILPHSKTPEKDLQELGDGSPDQVTFARIAWFYAKRPQRWWKVVKRRLPQAFTRTPYGNFEAPRSGESQAFDAFSAWKHRSFPRTPGFWLAMIALYAAVLVAKWRLGDARDRSRALVSAMLVAGCVLQFVAVITFEANGTEKHFFVFNVLVDLVLVLAIFEVARLAGLVWERAWGAPGAPYPNHSRLPVCAAPQPPREVANTA